MNRHEYDKLYIPFLLISMTLLLMNVYWFAYELFRDAELNLHLINKIVVKLSSTGIFSSTFKLKFFVYVILFVSLAFQKGAFTDRSWFEVIALIVVGSAVFFYPFREPLFYALGAGLGYMILGIGFAMLGRKSSLMVGEDNDELETFEQNGKLIKTDMSVNFKIRYQYKKKKRIGYVNCLQPQRGVLIMGVPGSGKSFSVYGPFIETFLRKGFTLFLYDYKYPDLTKQVYNEYLLNIKNYKKKYGKVPKFCLINLDNPRQSMRCNPLNPVYLKDKADAHEISEVIMKNVSKGDKGGGNSKFFEDSAKVYIASLVWLLKKFKNGIYCTFPHLIELMGKNYKAVLNILDKDKELTIMAQPFVDALKDKAPEQLQGQIASARIPLLKFPSPSLYWALSGDDFTLDINNPDEPKILCVGNNPDRQMIYGTTLALYTARLFKIINHRTNKDGKKNLPCGVLLDELPTIYIKDLDNLIDTARSNDVCVILGIQDKSQLSRDYGSQEASVVYNSVGNVFAGQVNGETAKGMSDLFGKELRAMHSQTVSAESTSVSTSFQERSLLSQSKIETLSQGFFFGKVADEFGNLMKKKLFCGQILINTRKVKRKRKKWVSIPDFGINYFKTSDEQVRESVMKDPKRFVVEALADQIRNENYREHRADNNVLLKKEASIMLSADMKYNGMSEAQINGMLAEIIKNRQEEAMYKILEKNAEDITRDVLDIFDFYGINLSDYDKKDNAASTAAPTNPKPISETGTPSDQPIV